MLSWQQVKATEILYHDFGMTTEQIVDDFRDQGFWVFVYEIRSVVNKTKEMTKSNTFIEHDGKSRTITEWSRKTGISRHTIRCRLLKGWSPAQALTTPVMRKINNRSTNCV